MACGKIWRNGLCVPVGLALPQPTSLHLQQEHDPCAQRWVYTFSITITTDATKLAQCQKVSAVVFFTFRSVLPFCLRLQNVLFFKVRLLKSKCRSAPVDTEQWRSIVRSRPFSRYHSVSLKLVIIHAHLESGMHCSRISAS